MDPFASINPLSEEVDSTNVTVSLNTEVNSFFISKNNDDDNLMMIDGDNDDTGVNEIQEPINNIFNG